MREGIVAPDYPGPAAADWPDLLQVVENKVKPQRLNDNRENYARLWWQYGERRPGLQRALTLVDSALFLCRHSPHLAITRLEAGRIAADSIDVLTIATHAAFAVLQSRVHEVWARLMASSIKDDLRYTPSDSFETFPFPQSFETHPALEKAGQAYYDFRAALMVRNNEGLTKTYNRFHDPGETSSDITELRRLHEAMDRAALDAYRWTNIQPVCEFFPEFDDDEEEESTRTKKHFRYRWPDEVRDNVLARLLILNQQRYDEEVLAGLHDRADSSQTMRRRKSAEVDDGPVEDQGELDL